MEDLAKLYPEDLVSLDDLINLSDKKIIEIKPFTAGSYIIGVFFIFEDGTILQIGTESIHPDGVWLRCDINKKEVWVSNDSNR